MTKQKITAAVCHFILQTLQDKAGKKKSMPVSVIHFHLSHSPSLSVYTVRKQAGCLSLQGSESAEISIVWYTCQEMNPDIEESQPSWSIFRRTFKELQAFMSLSLLNIHVSIPWLFKCYSLNIICSQPFSAVKHCFLFLMSFLALFPVSLLHSLLRDSAVPAVKTL